MKYVIAAGSGGLMAEVVNTATNLTGHMLPMQNPLTVLMFVLIGMLTGMLVGRVLRARGLL